MKQTQIMELVCFLSLYSSVAPIIQVKDVFDVQDWHVLNTGTCRVRHKHSHQLLAFLIKLK